MQIKLLRWYERNARDLPWRGVGDPYAIWISEVMLQQTVARTVIPYYERWMKSFPDLRALADADLQTVLKHWEGMGYYNRAVSLHRAARILVENFAGRFPDDEESLRRLPGVGPYTAAAVAAIAFGRRTLPVDGLIRRVMFRFLGLREAASRKAEEKIRRDGLILVSKSRPGDGVQALMDLADAVCRPKNPRCSECPIRAGCVAYLKGDPERLPEKKKQARTAVRAAVGIWLRGGAVFLQKRPERGLFAGLWELPGGKIEPGESPEAAVVREFAEELGAKVLVIEQLPPIRYSYTRFDVTLHPFVVRSKARPKAGETRKFVPLGNLGGFPQPAANAKIWREFGKRRAR